MSTCPLCYSNKNSLIKEGLRRCDLCDLVFKTTLVSKEDEKQRYETHNNDVLDKGYLNYLDKLLVQVERFTNLNNEIGKSNEGAKKKDNWIKVLDFGCGPSKGVEALVTQKELDMVVTSYDPYFFKIDLNKEDYDVIYASECFEHFNKPGITIKKIKEVLKVEGILAISTHIHSLETDFSTWWYLKDKTHIVFYSKKTIDYICRAFDFEILLINSTQIVLKNVST